jgi:hypothetical protein
MLVMTAMCCSVALVSCGKTAKQRDADKHNEEVAAQIKAQDAEKAKADKAAADAKAAADQKTRDDALKAQDDKVKAQKIAAANGQATPPAGGPGAVKPGTPLPIGTPVKDDKKPDPNAKDNKPGAQTGQATSSGPAGNAGQNGQNGRDGVNGKDGKDGQTLVVGGGNGTGTQTGTQNGTQSTSSSVAPPVNNNPSKDSAGLQSDFAAEALNLLDLGQAVAIWSSCAVTPETQNQPAAAQQAMRVSFTVEKSGTYHRTRQLYQGCDSGAVPLAVADQKDGDLKVVSREAGSTADAITYKIDLTYYVFGGAPAQNQGGTATPNGQKATLQTLIRIERQSGTLFLAADPAAGGQRPTTVDGGDKLKHN